MARKVGLVESGTRSWRYWPALVCEAASAVESETSIVTWNKDSAAGETVTRGADTQVVVVSCLTAAAEIER